VYNKVQTGQAANTESRNLDTLRAGVKNIYGGQVTYVGLTPQVLLNARVVPDNMRSAPDASAISIINGFGGTVTVNVASFNTGTNNAFAIGYPQIPVDVCSKFVAVAGNSFNKVDINGTVVKDTSNPATGNTIDVAGTAAACGAGGAVTVTFTSL
jgi:hypothetical protein